MEPFELLDEIGKTNEQIRNANRSRLELVEQFNGELRTLIVNFENTPDNFRVFVDLSKRLNRVAQRIERARQSEALDYGEHFDKALAVLRKRKFETAKKELNKIAVLGILAKQRALFDEYKKTYMSLSARRDELKKQLSSAERRWASLSKVDLSCADELPALKNKFDTYNREVGALLEDYFKSAPSRESLKVGLDAGYVPELGFPKPVSHKSAANLHAFLLKEHLSSEPVSKLLEYVKYSENKLSHYVSDTTTFRQVMESNIVWLESLDDISHRSALKLSLKESGDVLLVRIPQIISFLSKISSPKEILTFLRDLRKLVLSGQYDRMRSLSSLDADQIENIKSGQHFDDLKSLQDQYSEVVHQIEKLPDPRTIESQLA